MTKKGYFLSIGTNLGNRCKNLEKTVNLLKEKMRVISVSSIYETEAIDMAKGAPSFLNLVLKAETILNPYELLIETQKIETLIGRTRKSSQENKFYENRIIDIDILLAQDRIINSEKLTIPHKKIKERTFVLIPLCEIDNTIIHPITKKTFISYLKINKDNKYVKKYDCKNQILNIK